MNQCDSLSLARSISSRSRVPESLYPTCGATLHIGFFFDGFARHRENDMADNKCSNIARLFVAHKEAESDDNFNIYRRIYLSGLGADYDATFGATAQGSVDTAQGKISDIPAEVTGDQVLQGVRDSWHGNSWWQRLQRQLGELRQNPLKGLKIFKDAAINTVAEVSAPIRDSRWAASLLKTGVDTRLQGALEELDAVIEKTNQGSIPLRTIKISVFGFDFGATLARAFVHTVFERSQKQGNDQVYRQARIEVVFAGLFDAVDRTSAEVPPLEFFLPTTNALDDGGLIHPEVKALLHLVAAHERRFYRRARLLGDQRRGWREELMPGVSEDIGGGIAPGEQKPSNELALVSLHRMYRAAYSAGVSLFPLQELGEKDFNIAKLFIFNDKTPNQQGAQSLTARYRRLLGHQTPGHDGFLLNMRYYIRWLANIWQAYKAELQQLDDREDSLYQSQFSDSSWLAKTLGLGSETARQREIRLEQTSAIHQRRAELHNHFRWLSEVDEEARDMRNRLRIYRTRAAGTRQQLEVWLVLLTEWFEPSPLEPEIADLFSFFVHDQQVLSNTQRTARWWSGENFFDIRGFDSPRGSLPREQASTQIRQSATQHATS